MSTHDGRQQGTAPCARTAKLMLVDVHEGLAVLSRGDLLAIPTETVYGLAADAAQPEAIVRVFRTKGRPADHPLILHLGDAAWAEHFGHVPDHAWPLLRRFWPGPLTVVVPRRQTVSLLVTGGQETVALRVPRHPLTLNLLQAFGRPLVAPSANRFGRTSPTSAEHVRSEFGEKVAILDGGACPVGLESTIVDFSGERPRLLRPGQVSRADLEQLLGPLQDDLREAPRAPGMLEQHYAPVTRTRLGSSGEGRFAWLGLQARSGAAVQLLLPADAEAYGRGLYAALRELDASGCDSIVVQPPPQEPQWEAVWDRLRRATAP